MAHGGRHWISPFDSDHYEAAKRAVIAGKSFMYVLTLLIILTDGCIFCRCELVGGYGDHWISPFDHPHYEAAKRAVVKGNNIA